MKIKTSSLSGTQLDWAVGVANKAPVKIHPVEGLFVGNSECWRHYRPSTEWGQGGPIIDRHLISLHAPSPWINPNVWAATIRGVPSGHFHSFGGTPLIAAMRCYVASKLGDEVEIPEG